MVNNKIVPIDPINDKGVKKKLKTLSFSHNMVILKD